MSEKKKIKEDVYPPRKAQYFLRSFLKEALLEEVMGDLEEKFFIHLKQHTLASARRHYWYQTINYLRPFAIKTLKSPNPNHYDMYKNYFKIGYRNLLRNKVYSFINIGGLSVGMTIAIMIGLWLQDELSYNKYHQNNDRIAQALQHQTYNNKVSTGPAIPIPLGAAIRQEFGSDFKYVVMSSWFNDHILGHEQKKLTRKGAYMEVNGPKLLALNMLSGTRDGIKDPKSILISKSTAQDYFGEVDATGKMMSIDNEVSVTISGVYEDIPSNSRFSELDFIAPWELYVATYSWIKDANERQRWDDNSFQLFVQIADHAEMNKVNDRIKDIKLNALAESEKHLQSVIFLHPMKDWHLRSAWKDGINKGGFIQYIWLFGIVGLFVLILACINFMNLSTAQSERRAKEVGVRKSLGSLRGQLISQFISESFLVVFLSFVVALLLVLILLPSFNLLANKDMSLPLLNPAFWMTCGLFLLFTGFLAGSYPALYLSAFQPIKVLKGSFKAGRSAAKFRQALVILQFTISVLLIIGTLMVEKQIQHTKNRPLGYNSDGVIMIEIATSDYEGKFATLKEELIQRNAILEMAQSSSPLTDLWNFNDGFGWEGKPTDFNAGFATVWVSHDFGNTIDWQLAKGRDFSRDFLTDSTAFIVNEAAAKYMNLDDPVGKTISWYDGKHEIIGVVKDILMESPFQAVKQTIYMINRFDNINMIELKLNPDMGTANSLAIVEEVFKKQVPQVPFEYKFADQEFAKKFDTEERVRKLSRIFALLAIFISCLGIFGLSSFVAAQRKKEIGIRKVLGASVLNLWHLLTKDFFILVLISCLIAIPIAYWGSLNWLDNYEYQTSLSWWVFGLAGLAALVITLITVSFQTLQAGIENPIQSLRSE